MEGQEPFSHNTRRQQAHLQQEAAGYANGGIRMRNKFMEELNTAMQQRQEGQHKMAAGGEEMQAHPAPVHMRASQAYSSAPGMKHRFITMPCEPGVYIEHRPKGSGNAVIKSLVGKKMLSRKMKLGELERLTRELLANEDEHMQQELRATGEQGLAAFLQ